MTEATSDIRGTSSVHVFVVDEEGDPVTGQDVAAHFSDAQGRDTGHHQYSDIEVDRPAPSRRTSLHRGGRVQSIRDRA